MYIIRLLLFSLVLTFPWLSINGQIVKLDDGTKASIDNKIEIQRINNNLTGLSVGIVYGGEIVYARGFGDSGPFNVPFTENTRSLLASISKTITGVMAMKMVENGDFALDDEIEDYIPLFNNSGITIRHLLTHQSGIDHYNTCPSGYSGQFNALSSILLVSDCSQCVQPPGAGSLYTTQGSTLLGAVIEYVGQTNYNMGYEELYEDWIRGPAGLTSLTPESGNGDPGIAQGYTESGTLIGESFNDIGWKLPAGGFIGNVIDLAKYAAAVMDNTFLNSLNTSQMFVDQPDGTGEVVVCNAGSANNADNYGLSWRVNNNGSVAWHSGLNSYGYSAYLRIFPNQEAAIALLNNNLDQADVLNAIANDIQQDVLCTFARNFQSDIDWQIPTIYEAESFIHAESEVLSNGGSQQFVMDAGNWIEMKRGFEVKSGRKFLATIDGCGGDITPY